MSSEENAPINRAPIIVENDRVYLRLQSDAAHNDWIQALGELDLVEVQGRHFWLEIEGLEVTSEEIQSLKTTIENELRIELCGVRLARSAARAMLKEQLGMDVEYERTPLSTERRTTHVKRTIRSGRALRYEGHVVLMGDVNPGAHIAATGNITILGALKGTAHAGANGDDSAYVMALTLNPIQVRIGRRIAVSPPTSRFGSEPQVASVHAGQITFEPYRRFILR